MSTILRDFAELAACGYSRIGIFGGSYDPIHRAHIEMACRVKQRFRLDAVVFVPAYQNPLKVACPVDGRHRVEMIRLALQEHGDDANFFVCPIELESEGKSYTVHTMTLLRTALNAGSTGGGGAEVYFITGSDVLPGLHKWKDIRVLLGLVHMVMIKRDAEFNASSIEKAPVAAMLSDEQLHDLQACCVVDMPVIDISSTQIRNAIIEQRRDDYVNALSPSVVDYIHQHRLYTSSGGRTPML